MKSFLCVLTLVCLLLFGYVDALFFLRSLPKEPRLSSTPMIVQELFHDPFVFFGSGSQCLVFASTTKPYLCKICKANRYQTIPYIDLFYQDFKKEERRMRDLRNYHTAYEELSEETGILYLHFTETAWQHTHYNAALHIKLLFGLHITLPSDRLLFYIQKRARPILSYLDDPTTTQANIHTFLCALFHSVQKMCCKGFRIRDIYGKHMIKNLGEVDGKPLWMDPGRMVFTSKLKDPMHAHHLLCTFAEELSKALQETHPHIDVLSAFTETIKAESF